MPNVNTSPMLTKEKLKGVLPKGHRRPERPRSVLFLLAEAGDSVEFLPIREIMSLNWGLGNTPLTFGERRGRSGKLQGGEQGASSCKPQAASRRSCELRAASCEPSLSPQAAFVPIRADSWLALLSASSATLATLAVHPLPSSSLLRVLCVSVVSPICAICGCSLDAGCSMLDAGLKPEAHLCPSGVPSSFVTIQPAEVPGSRRPGAGFSASPSEKKTACKKACPLSAAAGPHFAEVLHPVQQRESTPFG